MIAKSSRETIKDRRLFVRGQTIFKQGDLGDAAYIVEEGRVGIYLTVEEGEDEMQLGTIEPGGIFGEMAVIDGGARMAGAVALEKTTLIRIPKEVFEARLQKTDPFVRAVLAIFMNNIRNAHNIYIRRPRSLSDYARMILAFGDNMRTYVNLIDVSDFSQDLAAKLQELDKVAQELHQLVRDHKDRRDNVFAPGDEQGIHPREVLGRDHG